MSIYLYIKTHQKTGLKYFGKTTNNNPYEYKGSGKYWRKHLKKHDNHVDTEILGYYTEDKVEEIALKFSKDNNIVESKEWANLIEENGLDGGSKHSEESKRKLSKSLKGKTKSEEHRAKMSAAQTGKKRGPHSEETKAKISAAKKGKKGKPLSEETKAKISAAIKGRTLSEEHKAKISASEKGKTVSEETRTKLSAAQKGKKHSEETKAKISAARKVGKGG
jgi:hypothetical protein